MGGRIRNWRQVHYNIENPRALVARGIEFLEGVGDGLEPVELVDDVLRHFVEGLHSPDRVSG